MNTLNKALRVVYASLSSAELDPVEVSREDPAKQTAAIEKFINRAIRTKMPEFKDKVFAVGGFVRDRLIGKNPKDLDLVVDDKDLKMDSAKEFVSKLANLLGITTPNNPHLLKESYGIWGLDLVHPKEDGVRRPFIIDGVDVSGYTLEVTPPRKEGPYSESKREPEYVEYASREEDAVRRDLTINSLYKNITGVSLEDSPENIEDYTGGMKDLQERKIRKPSHQDLREDQIYIDDPLRIFRLVRFSGKLSGFEVDENTEEVVKKFIQSPEGRKMLNSKVSKERVRDEFSQILTNPDGNTAVKSLELMKDWGLLDFISPDLNKLFDIMHDRVFHRGESVWDHTMGVLRSTPPSLKARLSALFHDIGKIETMSEEVDKQGRPRVHFKGHEDVSSRMIPKILSDLKYPSDVITSVRDIAHAHMGFKDVGNMGAAAKLRRIRLFIEKLYNDLDDAISILKADSLDNDDPQERDKEIALLDNLEREIKEQLEQDKATGLIYEKNLGHPQYIDPLSGDEIQDEYRSIYRKRMDKKRGKEGLPPASEEEFLKSFKVLEGKALGYVKSELKRMVLEGRFGGESISQKAREKLKNILGNEEAIKNAVEKSFAAGKSKSFYST